MSWQGWVSRASLPLLAWTVAACTPQIRPPAPRPAATQAPIIEIPESSVDVPVRVDLSDELRGLEAEVPAELDRMGAWTHDGGNRRYKYYVRRDPFRFGLDGSVLEVASTFGYEAEGQGRLNRLTPWLSGSCGSRPHDLKRIAAAYRTRVGLTPDWGLSSSTSISRLEPLDRCRVTIFNIDVTDKIVDAFRGVMERGAGKLDERARQVSLRGRLEPLWERFQTPIPLGDEGWLVLNPTALRFGGFHGEGTGLSTSLGVNARPEVVIGDRPAVTFVPLPAYAPSTPGSGIHLALLARLEYDEASRALAEELVGKQFVRAGNRVEITYASIYGVGSDQLIVQVGFKGDAKGRIYFVGTPAYDALTQTLTVPDLDFDLDTRNLLLKAADWLAHDDLVQFLRTRAKWTVASQLNEARARLDEAMDRELGGGVRMDGEVTGLHVQGLRAEVDGLHLLVRADGRARISVP